MTLTPEVEKELLLNSCADLQLGQELLWGHLAFLENM